jgi:DNA-binding FrmR family transcriptional regulator
MDSFEAIALLRAAVVQLDEIVRLVENDGPCIETIQRIRMVQTGLCRVHDGLLASHLERCLDAALQDESCAETTMDETRDVLCCRNDSRW